MRGLTRGLWGMVPRRFDMYVKMVRVNVYWEKSFGCVNVVGGKIGWYHINSTSPSMMYFFTAE
jgi:hypothetical protein